MKVYVYWNLRTGGYSIQADEGPSRGLIIAYASEVMLSSVRCHINHTARIKCLTSKKRVHAGFKGTLEAFRGTYSETGLATVSEPARYLRDAIAPAESGRTVTYNPKRDESFVHRDDGSPFAGAARVYGRTREDGKADCFAL